MKNPQLASERNFEHYYTKLPILLERTFLAAVARASVVIGFERRRSTCSTFTEDDITVGNLVMILDFLRFIIVFIERIRYGR